MVLSARISHSVLRGFLSRALSDEVHFAYKCTDFYDPAGERTLLWNDPEQGIEWPVPGCSRGEPGRPTASWKHHQYCNGSG